MTPQEKAAALRALAKRETEGGRKHNLNWIANVLEWYGADAAAARASELLEVAEKTAMALREGLAVLEGGST